MALQHGRCAGHAARWHAGPQKCAARQLPQSASAPARRHVASAQTGGGDDAGSDDVGAQTGGAGGDDAESDGMGGDVGDDAGDDAANLSARFARFAVGPPRRERRRE